MSEEERRELLEQIYKAAKKWSNFKCYYDEYVDDCAQEYIIRAVYAIDKLDVNKSKSQQLHYCCRAGSNAGIRFIKKIHKYKNKFISASNVFENN